MALGVVPDGIATPCFNQNVISLIEIKNEACKAWLGKCLPFCADGTLKCEISQLNR